jgi:hypothetical protein
MFGALGGPDGVIGPDGDENPPVPTAFVAATSNSYAVPLVRPVTVQVVVVPLHSGALVHEE